MARLSKKIERTLNEIDRRADMDGTLTMEDRERIKAKAREHVQERIDKQRRDQKAALEAEYLERAVRDEEKAAGLHGAYIDVEINVAASAAYIMLDGTMYMHGLTYEVPENVGYTLVDIMGRTWEHENETNGRRRRADTGLRTQSRFVSRGMENASMGEPGQINSRTLPRI
jgi:hypothetical protein